MPGYDDRRVLISWETSCEENTVRRGLKDWPRFVPDEGSVRITHDGTRIIVQHDGITASRWPQWLRTWQAELTELQAQLDGAVLHRSVHPH